jgi:hypothetical protein
MALFGQQAKLERCLWWGELAGWPRGIRLEREVNCYNKFGRTSGTSGTVDKTGAQRSVSNTPIKPKNDLLTIAMVIVGAYLIWKYAIK